jgi:hypothetical protein
MYLILYYYIPQNKAWINRVRLCKRYVASITTTNYHDASDTTIDDDDDHRLPTSPPWFFFLLFFFFCFTNYNNDYGYVEPRQRQHHEQRQVVMCRPWLGLGRAAGACPIATKPQLTATTMTMNGNDKNNNPNFCNSPTL